ncbi:MAG: excinuclease ABC subunit UvrC [Candidatus Omnitrophica bacterium]|nr:excinuclease ABC subunit UvrC [Candidatus Omnitrophota bacterium]
MDIKEKINALPLTSGVYLMKDAAGRVIYVGKAVSLRKRVQSYFRPRGPAAFGKTQMLVAEIADIDYILTPSEAGALLLEASLVRKYRPKYNVELKDDKSYPYIEITAEPFPRVALVRSIALVRGGVPGPNDRRKKASVYYGPYVSAGLVREALAIIRKIFHFRTCDPFPHQSCLDYHIGLCDAPCIQNISRRDYARNIRRVRLVLEGKKDTLYKSLKQDMEEMAREQQFEQAAKVRDQIRAIGALYSGTRDINYFKEAEQLQRVLGLPRMPERIETFDISNIMGDQAVGAMVAFWNGRPDKSNYRRFRIRDVAGIDDFEMIAEVVRRRYGRLQREGRVFPDLVVIDGGKGQLSSACRALEALQVEIPVVSIAKREEEIFVPRKRDSLKLPPDSLALQLLQRVRDEAHRFAVSYHRKLRHKNVFGV